PGDVDAGGLSFQQAPVGIEDKPAVRPQNPALAIDCLEEILDAYLRRLGRQPIEHSLHRGPFRLAYEGPEVTPGKRLSRRAPGPRIGSVDENDPSVPPETAQHLRLAFDENAVTLLACSQRLLCLYPCRLSESTLPVAHAALTVATDRQLCGFP